VLLLKKDLAPADYDRGFIFLPILQEFFTMLANMSLQR
jgi:hypothetical protein